MTCPVCGKAAVAAYRPFCSRRCADVDLGRWLTGGYAIPAEPAGEDDIPEGDEGTPPPGGRPRPH